MVARVSLPCTHAHPHPALTCVIAPHLCTPLPCPSSHDTHILALPSPVLLPRTCAHPRLALRATTHKLTGHSPSMRTTAHPPACIAPDTSVPPSRPSCGQRAGTCLVMMHRLARSLVTAAGCSKTTCAATQLAANWQRSATANSDVWGK
jgi:hypothetical protein